MFTEGVSALAIKLGLKSHPATRVAEDILHRIFPEWWELFARKNAGYGQKNSSGDDLGIKATIPDINRKVNKLKRYIWWEQPVPDGDEGPREIALDLIGHLFMLVNHLDKEEEKKQPPTPGLHGHGEVVTHGGLIKAPTPPSWAGLGYTTDATMVVPLEDPVPYVIPGHDAPLASPERTEIR